MDLRRVTSQESRMENWKGGVRICACFRGPMTGFLNAVYEVRDKGEFSFLDSNVITQELSTIMHI